MLSGSSTPRSWSCGSGGQLYLHLWDGYLKSTDLQGTWTLATSVPSAVQSVEKSLGSSKSVDLMTGRKDPKTGRTPSLKTTPIPDIVVATRSTSLVVFAGPPQWAPLDGTQLMYATNTMSHVFQYLLTQAYYVLTSGRWFTAADSSGPWIVAKSIPPAIYTIPISSPLHWVTYVRIYQTAGDFVWVGYSPGYYGTVLGDSGTVVYGTGYPYDPYIGGIYVPAPVTYGYDANLAWTPWGGWGFGFAAGWAWGASFTYWAVPPPVPYWGAYAGWTANRFGGFRRGGFRR